MADGAPPSAFHPGFRSTIDAEPRSHVPPPSSRRGQTSTAESSAAPGASVGSARGGSRWRFAGWARRRAAARMRQLPVARMTPDTSDRQLGRGQCTVGAPPSGPSPTSSPRARRRKCVAPRVRSPADRTTTLDARGRGRRLGLRRRIRRRPGPSLFGRHYGTLEGANLSSGRRRGPLAMVSYCRAGGLTLTNFHDG